MKPIASCRLIARVLAPASLLWAACGGANQSQATAPSQPEPLGQTNMQAPTPAPAAATVPLPNTPTAARVEIAPEILRACNIPDADAYFPFDSSKLTSFDHEPLEKLAACFSRGPLKGRTLRLVGHADPRGPSDYNMALGQSRADAVAGFLDHNGLERSHLTTTSRGAMDATGREETGWAHDRRVDALLEEK